MNLDVKYAYWTEATAIQHLSSRHTYQSALLGTAALSPPSFPSPYEDLANFLSTHPGPIHLVRDIYGWPSLASCRTKSNVDANNFANADHSNAIDIATAEDFDAIDIATAEDFDAIDIATVKAFNAIDIANADDNNVDANNFANADLGLAKNALGIVLHQHLDGALQLSQQAYLSRISTLLIRETLLLKLRLAIGLIFHLKVIMLRS